MPPAMDSAQHNDAKETAVLAGNSLRYEGPISMQGLVNADPDIKTIVFP
jgi:hypothetical protein